MRIREDLVGVVQIEFAAFPRKRVCGECLGFGCVSPPDHQQAAERCPGCVGQGVIMPPYAPFDTDTVKPVGKFKSAKWVMTVDDVAVAGFVDRESAVSAAMLMTGYVDGLGRPVDERTGVHWPACDGRVVRVVGR